MGDEDGLAYPEVPDNTDTDVTLDAVGVPNDAGPYAGALASILGRIPERWGRWIDLDAGWYPLVVSVDERLAAIDPEYVVHQIKEKYGTLRYYCSPRGDEPATQRQAAFDSIIGEAERASATTCERCGQPGMLRHSTNLVKTLCASCADTLGYA